MALPKTFEKIRPSIVAFGSRLVVTDGTAEPLMPNIIGTGFFVDSRGIAATNRHVAEALIALPRLSTSSEDAAFAFVFSPIVELEGGLGLGAAIVKILRYEILTEFESAGEYYGEAVPDLALIQLNIKDVSPVQLATGPYSVRVGTDVATAGFPLGEDPLVVYGAANQGTPFLRRGVVSSVLPFPCPRPHGFTLDVMSQGGASGSPIFLLHVPIVVGILHAGIPSTNFTFAVPSQLIHQAYQKSFGAEALDLSKVPSLSEYKAEARRVTPKWTIA